VARGVVSLQQHGHGHEKHRENELGSDRADAGGIRRDA
jgi:hypothetical protein